MRIDPADFVKKSIDKYEPEAATADAADAADDKAKAAQLFEEMDELVDEWGEDSFPASDPPGYY